MKYSHEKAVNPEAGHTESTEDLIQKDKPCIIRAINKASNVD